jgi:ribose 1,5-bisphosphokinase
MSKGRFIAVVGPSGVGKDSVMAGMAQVDPRIRLARRVITRPQAQGAEQYDGVTDAEFKAMEKAGAFALSWAAHGLQYGIPAEVDAILEGGRDVVANLSRGILGVAEERFSPFMVLSLSARQTVLQERLQARGREDADDIESRLRRASYRMPEGLTVVALDNSGALEDTVSRALNALYPISA